MTKYIDWSHVAGRYPEVSKHTQAFDAGSYHIAFAEAELESRLSKVYSSLPTSPNASPFIQDIAIDIAYYKMTWRQSGSEKLKEYIDDRVDKIIENNTTIAGATTTNAAWTSSEEHATAFGPDNELNWRPSDNWIDDVQGERD